MEIALALIMDMIPIAVFLFVYYQVRKKKPILVDLIVSVCFEIMGVYLLFFYHYSLGDFITPIISFILWVIVCPICVAFQIICLVKWILLKNKKQEKHSHDVTGENNGKEE